MTKINFDELDERTARVLLACASGPGDPDVDHLVQVLDPVEAVGFFLNPPDSGALSPLADTEWVKTAATRLSMRDAQEAFEASERIGARILIPGDPESPTQLGNLQERAPFATVWFTVSSGEEAAEFTARRAKNLAEHDRGPVADDDLAASTSGR